VDSGDSSLYNLLVLFGRHQTALKGLWGIEQPANECAAGAYIPWSRGIKCQLAGGLKNLAEQKLRCPKCGAEATAEDDHTFCVDRAPLHGLFIARQPLTIMHECKCGAHMVSEPKHCQSCGLLWEKRRHVEYSLGDDVAAVTDIGLHHRHNEDDVRIAIEKQGERSLKIMVVCDGLSSAQLAHEASARAAQAVIDTLTARVARSFDPVKAMSDAIARAHESVCTIKYKESDRKGPPGATVVAAILSGTTAIIGWVGDSRAYVASSFGAKLLTRDHTWFNEVLDSGRMTEEEALRLVNPHILTKCIGPMEVDSSGEPPAPSVVSVQLPALSWLVLCSDGLWNYDEKLSEFDEVVKASYERSCALTFARRLVSFANSQGGRDNITVAVACTS